MIIIKFIDDSVLDFNMKSFDAEREFVEKFATMPLNRIMDLKQFGKFTVAQVEDIKFQPIKPIPIPASQKLRKVIREKAERLMGDIEDKRHLRMEAFIAAVTARLGHFPEDDPNVIQAMQAAGDSEDWKLPMFVNLACNSFQKQKK